MAVGACLEGVLHAMKMTRVVASAAVSIVACGVSSHTTPYYHVVTGNAPAVATTFAQLSHQQGVLDGRQVAIRGRLFCGGPLIPEGCVSGKEAVCGPSLAISLYTTRIGSTPKKDDVLRAVTCRCNGCAANVVGTFQAMGPDPIGGLIDITDVSP